MVEGGSTHRTPALSHEQLATLRQRLTEERARVMTRLAREEAVAREAEELTEPMDAAEQTREQEDAGLFGDRDRARLREIDDALGRMETGRYGVSEATGKPIDFRRLLAVPWARTEEENSPS